jgi:hypothetical protein
MAAVPTLVLPPPPSLAPGEALVLWALRLGAAAPANGPLIDQELTLAYGPLDGPPAAGALARLAAALEHHSRRALRFALLSGAAPMPDERAVLLLLAASQARDWALRDALLLWLVRPAGRDVAARAALALGAALDRGGHALPPPQPVRPPQPTARAVP